MYDPPNPTTHCSLPEFLALANMSKGTFFTRYRHEPRYAALLDVKQDRMHRVWLARAGAAALRAERSHKEKHGNRGRTPVRVCLHCGFKGHPRHKSCRQCGILFSCK